MDDKQYEHLKTFFNECEYCNVNMLYANYYYECPSCGLQKEIEGSIKDCDDDATSSLRRYNYFGQSFSLTPEYTKIQRRNILNQLLALHSAYMSKKPQEITITKEIICEVCRIYNNIQKIVVNEDDKKKFVRRGNVKDEILGALIKRECLKNGNIIKIKDVCEFMNLKTQGISRGENILRNLQVDGLINFPLTINLYAVYTQRYLKGINIYSERYEGFIGDLIAECIKKRIGTNSIATSKVSGSIWLLILHERLPITFQELEAATKNIRKNTWSRYTKIIQKNILRLIDVFKRWNIDHGVRGGLFLIKRGELEALNRGAANYKMAAKNKTEFLELNN